MIVLDASVLIAHLDDRDVHHEKAESLLIAAGPEPLGASTITLAETLVAPARAGRLAEANSILDRLGISELPLGDQASTRLAQLRADTGCKLPDCCVLLTAQEHDAGIASFDLRLSQVATDMGIAVLDA